MMKRLLLLLLLSVLAAGSAFAGTISLEPGTPVFRTAEMPGEVIAVAAEPTVLETTGQSRLFLIRSHPLARYFRMTEVRLPDGRTGYVHPAALLHPDGQLEVGNVVEFWRYPLAALLGGALAALLVILWKRRREPDPWRWVELGLVPILLRMFLLILLVNRAQNIIASPADEPGYYMNLLGILNWDFSERWHFTVGTSLFYLPFELLSGTRNLIDIMIPLSWVEGFVIAPCSLWLGYVIGRKLTGSDIKASLAMLGWAILPFIWHHQPDFTERFFIAFFEFPSAEFTYRHYINLIGCGFSAMSDTPSTCLMLTVFALLICRRASYRTAAAAAFLFGVACLFRINNIMFVPAIGAICLVYRPEYFRNVRETVRYALLGALAFLIGFLPQMLANWKFFGNPLKFSYTNYAEGAHTYVDWIFVELNSMFYATVNQLLWIPAILALFFLRDRKLRLVLALWAIPVIFFFFGYSHGTDDPVRFILTTYPALFLAVAASNVWERLKPRDFLWTIPLLAGWILCIPNAAYGRYDWYLSAPYRMLWRLGDFSWITLAGVAAMAVGIVMIGRKSRKTAAFLTVCSVLYLFGNGYWLVLGFVAVLICAVRDAFILFRQRRSGKPEEPPLPSAAPVR
ncbi:hypothetical protein [uncultured Victivallis sp.]|uniref:hypothetical protein n=1 Tax=uncultured Victivallis sp. TaxID=354118 RepID=UPI0025E02C0C|nr:hypothetical protein [uncultured Victivallis sp.]